MDFSSLRTPDVIVKDITRNVSKGIPYSLTAKDGVKLISAINNSNDLIAGLNSQLNNTRQMMIEILRTFGGQVTFNKEELNKRSDEDAAVESVSIGPDGKLIQLTVVMEEEILRVGDIVYEDNGKKKPKEWVVMFVGDTGFTCIAKVSAKLSTQGRIIETAEVMKWDSKRVKVPTLEEMKEKAREMNKPKSNIIL